MELFGRTRSQTRFLRELEALRGFPSFLKDYFEPFIKAGEESSKFDWSSVDRFYKNFQNRLTNCHSLKMFCDFVLKLFLKFNSDDERLMARIIFIFSEFTLPKYDDVFNCEDCTNLICRRQSHFSDPRPLLRELNGVREEFLRFNCHSFYFHQRGIKSRSDCTFLLFLLKYGISYFPDRIEHVHKSYKELKRNYYEMRGVDMIYDPDDKTYLYKFQKILVNPRWRRLFLIIEIVDNLFKREDNEHASVECFRLYSLSISEPAITEKEVEDFLDLAFVDDRGFKIDALANLKKFCDDIPKIISPRSLKQLCRIQIRGFLPRSRPPLPSAVAALELLPDCLKNYLLFLCD